MGLHAVVTSDWHLLGMNKIFRDPLARQIEEIHKPYRYATENGIRHIMVPGDMCDVPSMDDRTLITLITFLMTYDDHIETHYQLGNHDVAHNSKTSMDVLKVLADSGFFKRFHLYTKPTVKKIEGVYCTFMPFPFEEVPESPKPPVVFAHIEVAGAIGDNGRPLKHGNDEKFIRQEGDYVFSGHIHQHQILAKKRFAYCGTLYQKNFGEALPKGFIDFEAKYVGGELKVKPNFISSKPNFTLETKIITCSDDWETLSKEDNIRYKILTQEGIIVPKNIQREFPNIVYIQGASKSVRVNMEQEEGVDQAASLKDLPTFSVTTGLKKYLKDAELDPAQVKRAIALVKEARHAVGV